MGGVIAFHTTLFYGNERAEPEQPIRPVHFPHNTVLRKHIYYNDKLGFVASFHTTLFYGNG